MLCVYGCARGQTPLQEPQGKGQDNNAISIDVSKIAKANEPECLPVKTTSIREILNGTGRFANTRIDFPERGGALADEIFSLDKSDSDTKAAGISYQVLAGDTTQVISYNFSKHAVNGDEHEAIKWGLDLLLHIFGTQLTHEAWDDIMLVAAKAETEEAWGTDYAGFSYEESGIRLIYSNLGSGVQVDIRVYSDRYPAKPLKPYE